MSQNPQNQNPFTFDQTLLQKIDHDILFHARRLYDRMNDKCDMDKDYTCTKCDDGMNSVLSRGQCNFAMTLTINIIHGFTCFLRVVSSSISLLRCINVFQIFA